MPFVGGSHTLISNPRWRTAAILEKSKNRYISAAVRAISTKFGMMTQYDPLDHLDCQKFEISKIQDGGGHRLEKLPYLGCSLSDFDEHHSENWTGGLLAYNCSWRSLYFHFLVDLKTSPLWFVWPHQFWWWYRLIISDWHCFFQLSIFIPVLKWWS